MSSADDVRERAALLRLLWPKEDNMDVFERAAEALWQAGRPILGEELARATAELRSAVSEELAFDLGGIGAKRLAAAEADLARARAALADERSSGAGNRKRAEAAEVHLARALEALAAILTRCEDANQAFSQFDIASLARAALAAGSGDGR